MNPSYYTYRMQVLMWRGAQMRAKLVLEHEENGISVARQLGIGSSPRQIEPFTHPTTQITYMVDRRWKHPDAYIDDRGFTLYSNRLLRILHAFDVQFETLPIVMVDRDGLKIDELDYSIFHSLETMQSAMDEVKSQWTGDRHDGVKPLVLDYASFDHRPLFLVNKLYIPLIRGDLKEAIQKEELTGLGFLSVDKYQSGKHGLVTRYDD